MAEETKSLAERVDELITRVSTLERRYGSVTLTNQTAETISTRAAFFTVPQVPKKWVNGTILHYYFYLGSPWGADSSQLDVVRRALILPIASASAAVKDLVRSRV